MRKIHKLPEYIISKIAAGEVIERPVYAVKELVENALDAKADTVKIDIEDSGLKKISVTDNGQGMSKEDLLECFKPHTTSKLTVDAVDLIGISSMGFRGEALASIAAISTMTIQSRRTDEPTGNLVELKNGEVEKTVPVGMPVGTTVSIYNLFSTVPARKKFLKSIRTEFRHIIDLVSQFALANPEKRFILLHNGKIIFDLPKSDTLPNRVSLLLGLSIQSYLFPISSQGAYLKISGFLSTPQLKSYTNRRQYLFINQRPVTDKNISLIIKQAYGNILEATAQPMFLLFLTLPFESVDVNVHPRKEQVRVVEQDMLLSSIADAVKQAVAEQNFIFQSSPWQIHDERGSTKSFAGQLLKDEVTPWGIKKETGILKSSDFQQIHKLYILVQTKNGLLLIDQHATHERILYEQFLGEFLEKKKKQKMSVLAETVRIDLSPIETEILQDHLDTFLQLGFSIEQFQGYTFLITAVPELFKDRNIELLIKEMLDDLLNDRSIKTVDEYSKKMIAYLACRTAIKAGDVMTKQEAKELVETLEKTPNNATCPHGRPTRVEMPLRELNKLFKRS